MADHPTSRGESVSVTGTVLAPEGGGSDVAVGRSNLVIDGSRPFDIEVSWHFPGGGVPSWLRAGATDAPTWVVTAYVPPRGPGDGISLGSVKVPVGRPAQAPDDVFTATISVPANILPEEDRFDPTQSGVYQIELTVFLESDRGPVGHDMLGQASGPLIKVEYPEGSGPVRTPAGESPAREEADGRATLPDEVSDRGGFLDGVARALDMPASGFRRRRSRSVADLERRAHSLMRRGSEHLSHLVEGWRYE